MVRASKRIPTNREPSKSQALREPEVKIADEVIVDSF
jgi:hypothetical protein